MEIIFYNNKSSNNTLNKTITETFRTSGTLRDETSIVDPVIVISQNPDTISTSNYAYIPSMKRYYYITNVESVRNGLVMITMHVDVLMSFKSDIDNVSGIVLRSTAYSNPFIIDGNIRTMQYSDYEILPSNKEFSSSLSHYIVVAG